MSQYTLTKTFEHAWKITSKTVFSLVEATTNMFDELNKDANLPEEELSKSEMFQYLKRRGHQMQLGHL